MPKDTSIRKILVIGSGPIVIGQGCEFDYSGVQACKALKEEGYEVILVNSNPATIMTDPEFAHRTYIEPITPEVVEKIIIREKPDALLPTLGGQTALNTSMALHKSGALDRHKVRMIGAKPEAIEKGEDRQLFIIRPAFTLGGQGGGIAYNRDEFEEIITRGLDLSPVSEVLIEESLLGWKEFEMEVMRDRADNCVVICSIENLDPMGVHTGDSITVAPIQTLTDREYQIMRDASFACIREIGVETGGSNIQFATDPKTGRMIVIEMNPRVSRSSALASKATGFPIAKIAAKLAVGYTLDELPNDITRETPASFEPTIDYVVTKIPRFTFEKFPTANPVLTTSMKSVGEAMSIGRTFKESMQKCLRSLETGRWGFGFDSKEPVNPTRDEITRKLQIPNAERIFWLQTAFLNGFTLEEIHELTRIDPWFLRHLQQIAEEGKQLASLDLKRAKKLGFSDRQIAKAQGTHEDSVRAERKAKGIIPTYRLVDTCAAEFEAYTPYFYSTYGDENEARETDKKKIIILGGGPNRIGQGIEFDYCCVHAAFAVKELGYEAIMVNSNPETVSTDYDTSDKLFFEPLTLEDVLNICDQEKPHGVIVQFGGQTPLNLAADLERHGVPIIGTSPKSIELAEDRKFFSALLDKLNLKQAEARQRTLPLHERGRHRLARAPGAGGPLPRQRHRGGCRLHLRRRNLGRRRDHGAHRAGRHPLRRLRLRHSGLFSNGNHQGGDCESRQGPRPRASGERPDEHPVRREDHHPAALLGEGSRLPVEPLPRHRHRARPGNEIHRRGHGHRPRLGHGLREIPDLRLQPAAHHRQRLPLGFGSRQGPRGRRRPRSGGTRFHPLLHRRHPPAPHRSRHPQQPRLQSPRTGPAERDRHDEEPGNPLRHQHAFHPRVPRRRDPHPLHRHRPENLLRHQPPRRRSQREGHPLAEGEGTYGEEHPGVSRVRARGGLRTRVRIHRFARITSGMIHARLDFA